MTSAADIVRLLGARIKRVVRPRDVTIVVSELPRTSTGKLVRLRLSTTAQALGQ